jgi:hypothetical protein
MIPSNVDFYGDQTRWFMGEVVDINDPVQLARIKVRVYGVHSSSILDDDLPWAQTVAPITEGGTEFLGNPLGIQVGALVFGMFLDGPNSQLPLVLGSIPKYEDLEEDNDRLDKSVNALARGTQTKPYTPDSVIGEPDDPYAAVYPNNLVRETQSGHVKEYDDTPDAERIRELHASGTFYQVNPDGTLTTHVVKDRYTVVAGDDAVHITGNVNIVVDGTVTIDTSLVTMTGNLRVDGDVSVGGDVVTDAGISHNTHTHTDNPGLAGAETTGPH